MDPQANSAPGTTNGATAQTHTLRYVLAFGPLRSPVLIHRGPYMKFFVLPWKPADLPAVEIVFARAAELEWKNGPMVYKAVGLQTAATEAT